MTPKSDGVRAPWVLSVGSDGPGATLAIAEALGQLCGPGDVFVMTGELGAGKTTFAKGLAASLGVPGPVTSPTFTLVRQYPCGPAGLDRGICEFLHADLYRLEEATEIDQLALPELIEDTRAVALIEWGERAIGLLAEAILHIEIQGGAGQDERTLRITGWGAWAEKSAQVDAALAGSRP